MNMTRRTFILSTGLVAVGPALASVLTTSPIPGSSVLPSAASLPSDLPFRIDGWEPREEMAADERMWISINQSWRANWR